MEWDTNVKIVASSDWHLDHMTHGVRRFDELRAATDVTADAAIEKQADVYVFAGDLTDPDSGSCVFEVLEVAIGIALRLARVGIPSLWLAGNHDVIENGRRRTTLAPMVGIHPLVQVFEQGVTSAVQWPGGARLEVLALPYPSATNGYDIGETLDHQEKYKVTEYPLLVLSHLTVPGVVPGEEVGEMARGRDVLYPVERVLKIVKQRKRAVMIQGHYHRQQSLNYGGVYMHIPGSLARLTFGEEHHRPGYIVVEV